MTECDPRTVAWGWHCAQTSACWRRSEAALVAAPPGRVTAWLAGMGLTEGLGSQFGDSGESGGTFWVPSVLAVQSCSFPRSIVLAPAPACAQAGRQPTQPSVPSPPTQLSAPPMSTQPSPPAQPSAPTRPSAPTQLSVLTELSVPTPSPAALLSPFSAAFQLLPLPPRCPPSPSRHHCCPVQGK